MGDGNPNPTLYIVIRGINRTEVYGDLSSAVWRLTMAIPRSRHKTVSSDVTELVVVLATRHLRVVTLNIAAIELPQRAGRICCRFASSRQYDVRRSYI